MKEKKELENYIINENIDLDKIVDDYTPYLRTIIQNMVGSNLTEEDNYEISINGQTGKFDTIWNNNKNQQDYNIEITQDEAITIANQ